MKRFLYLVVAVSSLFILVPSLINGFFNIQNKPEPTDLSSQKPAYEIAVVYKNSNHSASIKQWRTIVSAANYFTDNSLTDQYQFSLFSKQFKLKKFYEDVDGDLICDGIDIENQLANVVAILGPITSGCARRMTQNDIDNIPVITSFATLPSLNEEQKDFFYRTVPHDDLRASELLKLWKKDASESRVTNNLVIYDDNNVYSKDLFEKIQTEISKKHPTVHFFDISGNNKNTYDEKSPYESFFVMVDQELQAVSDVIKKVKIDQYTNHAGHRPKFYVLTELADALLFDTLGSVLAMTPTLLSYNRENAKTFLSIENKSLPQRSASSFLAFEALYRAIQGNADSRVNCTETKLVDSLRCGIKENLKQPFRSVLIGNIIEFNSVTRDIATTHLVKAEIRTLNTGFTYEPVNEVLPPLVTINYINERKAMWLGEPIKINLESSGNTTFKINFNYRAPEWFPKGLVRESLESLFSFSKEFLASNDHYDFHPRFIGVYYVEVAGLGADLRQSAGRHSIPISPPTDLFYLIISSLIIASIATRITPPKTHVLDKSRLFIEVTGAAIFMYLITVTLRGYSFAGAPTLSFSSEPITNLIYCAIIAGTVKLRIFAYFLNPIIARFTPSGVAEDPAVKKQ